MARKLTLSARAHPPRSARAAGLTYTRDDRPGIRRLKTGRRVRSIAARGKAVKAGDLKRIRHCRRFSALFRQMNVRDDRHARVIDNPAKSRDSLLDARTARGAPV